jgi:hypothetical protein
LPVELRFVGVFFFIDFGWD